MSSSSCINLIASLAVIRFLDFSIPSRIGLGP